MKRVLHLFATSVALLFCAGTQAKADFVTWTYSWSRTPESGSVTGGTGGVSLTNELEKTAVNSSDVVATNLRIFSSADPTKGEVDGLENGAGAYTLTITIVDNASGESGSLTFSGELTGTFTKDSANVANEFSGDLEQELTLGNNTYVVTIGPYSPPGPPSASNAGSIAAHVEVIPGGSVAETPEPSSLLLSCFGLTLAGGVARWRKRRAMLSA